MAPRSNDVWEQHLFDVRLGSLSPYSTREERLNFITEKYVQREFAPSVARSSANTKLFESSREGDVVGCISAIAMGADVNYCSPFTKKTCLREAIDREWLLIVELLRHWEASEVPLEDPEPVAYVESTPYKPATSLSGVFGEADADAGQNTSPRPVTSPLDDSFDEKL